MEKVEESSSKLSYKPIFSSSLIESKITTNMQSDGELSSSSEKLISEAAREVRKISLFEVKYEKNRRQMSYVVLGRLHELYTAAARDPALMMGLAKKSKLPHRKNTSERLYVVKAVLKLASSELKPQTVSDWAKVLHGLELAGVRPDSQHVVDWLSTPEDGTGLSGHEKAFAIVKRADVASEARAAEKIHKRKQAWSDYVTPKLDAPLAEMTFAEPVAVNDGYVLQLARIVGQHAKVIDIVMTNEDEIQRLVEKHRLAA